MKAKATLFGLMILASAVSARAETAPKDRPPESPPKELLGPRQDRFTKDFTARECGKRYCWNPVQLQHFQPNKGEK